MAKIARVEIRMVDLAPKVKRTDAIQSFVSQETPLVTITDSDGAQGTGYSYTIGTGGPAVVSLLNTLAPRLIGQEAEEIERLWRELLFATHATAVGAITSLAWPPWIPPCGICGAGARGCRCGGWRGGRRLRLRSIRRKGVAAYRHARAGRGCGADEGGGVRGVEDQDRASASGRG